MTLDTAKYMYDRFKELGISVKIIRSTDETVDPTERANKILNAFEDDPNVTVISNHINAGGGDSQSVTNKSITIKAKKQ